MTVRTAVFVSGQGSNLRRLVELDRGGELEGAAVVAVVTNRPECGGAGFARAAGLPLGVFRQRDYGSSEERDEATLAWLGAQEVDLLVLAGYDRVLTPRLTDAFPGRILNVHPSLLPAFAGSMHAVEAALAHGVKVTGCTVHLLGPELDGGPILLQAAVPVHPDDTVQSLHARIQREEHRLLPEAVRLVASGRAAVAPASRR